MGREMKRVAREDKLVVETPAIARLRPMVVEPETVRVAFELEHVRIAIAVSNVWDAFLSTVP